MKKVCFIILVLLFALLAGCVTQASVSETITPNKQAAETPSPTIAVTPSPTPSPTPVPTVNNMEISLDFSFGYRTGTYTGEILNNLPNGKGKFETVNANDNKWYYEGEWVDGHFSGEGKTVWETGQSESGTYAEDELTVGTRKFEDGRQQIGNFKNDLLNGQGEYIDLSGMTVFKGEFIDGMPIQTTEEIDVLKASLKEKCETFDYSKYARQPELYKGKYIYVTGRINSLFENSDGSIDCILGVKNSWSKEIYVQFLRSNSESMLLENDKVLVWGVFEGKYDSSYGSYPLVRALVMRLK